MLLCGEMLGQFLQEYTPCGVMQLLKMMMMNIAKKKENGCQLNSSVIFGW